MIFRLNSVKVHVKTDYLLSQVIYLYVRGILSEGEKNIQDRDNKKEIRTRKKQNDTIERERGRKKNGAASVAGYKT